MPAAPHSPSEDCANLGKQNLVCTCDWQKWLQLCNQPMFALSPHKLKCSWDVKFFSVGIHVCVLQKLEASMTTFGLENSSHSIWHTVNVLVNICNAWSQAVRSVNLSSSTDVGGCGRALTIFFSSCQTGSICEISGEFEGWSRRETSWSWNHSFLCLLTWYNVLSCWNWIGPHACVMSL